MAIVANTAEGPGVRDNSFVTANRSNVGSPVGSVTPQYAGEIVLDNTTGLEYQAMGLTSSTWVQATRTVGAT